MKIADFVCSVVVIKSDCLIITGVQGGRERKRSFSGYETLLCGLSSGSSNYESFPREVSLKKSCDLFIGFH